VADEDGYTSQAARGLPTVELLEWANSRPRWAEQALRFEGKADVLAALQLAIWTLDDRAAFHRGLARLARSIPSVVLEAQAMAQAADVLRAVLHPHEPAD
jgi:hypothetical protein